MVPGRYVPTSPTNELAMDAQGEKVGYYVAWVRTQQSHKKFINHIEKENNNIITI